MFSLNRVQLIGYQTQPVQLRQTPQGTSVTDLNLVTPGKITGEGGVEVPTKSFHTVTLWGPMAEVAAQFLRPAGQVFVSGRLQTDTWEGEKGEKRSKTKMVALDMILLDPKAGQLSPPDDTHRTSGTLLNRADLIGNVTRDPELRTTTSGQHVLSLGLATNDRWKDRATGEDRERAEFHSVVVWGDLAAEVGKVVRKGMRVHVAGRVQTRGWDTPDGSRRYVTEVVAETVSLLGLKSKVAQESLRSEVGPSSLPPRTTGEGMQEERVPQEVASSPSGISYGSDIRVEDLPF